MEYSMLKINAVSGKSSLILPLLILLAILGTNVKLCLFLVRSTFTRYLMNGLLNNNNSNNNKKYHETLDTNWRWPKVSKSYYYY